MTMGYFLFVLNPKDPACEKAYISFVEQLIQNRQKCVSSTCVKVVHADHCFQTGKVTSREWMPIKDVLDSKTDDIDDNTEQESDRCDANQCIGGVILDVSDSLPYSGASVYTVLFHPTLQDECDQSDISESNLPLYGALKKLSSWHNAQITFITEDCNVTESLQNLTDFTGASITSDPLTCQYEQPMWRGKISVLNKVDGQGHVFPGFQLHLDEHEADDKLLQRKLQKRCCITRKEGGGCDGDVVFGRILEVVDEVDSRTVPPFMLSYLTLKLSLWKDHQHSSVLLQELLNLNQTALIARLVMYSSDNIVDCSHRLSSQAWRDSLIANVDHVQVQCWLGSLSVKNKAKLNKIISVASKIAGIRFEDIIFHERDEDILSCGQFVHVLLMAGDESDHIKAVLLHDSSEINSKLFVLDSALEQMGEQHTVDCAPEQIGEHQTEQRMERYIRGLQHVSGDTLQHINDSLTSLQTQMLHDWIGELEKLGESTVMSSEMLWRFLGQIQERFLDKLTEDGVLDNIKPSTFDPLPVLESDLSVEPGQWAERLSLQHHDCEKREMRRYQSDTCLSSPLHADEAQSSVEVKDFLKLFRPDGNALKEKLSPIMQKSKRKMQKLSSQGDISMQWPDCQETRFHGIDYYKHSISEKNEKHFSTLRERYVKQETCSSFTTKTLLAKRKSMATASDTRRGSGGHNLMSPTRKSPRGSRPFNQKTTDEDVRPSFVQPSRQKLLMQHPGLKSPRKRQSLPSQQLRRSPRKQPSANFQRLKSDSDIALPPPPKRSRRSDPEPLDSSLEECPSASQAAKKPSRSERHKKKLEEICHSVLRKHGVQQSDAIFKSCSDKLFQVTKFFVKALPNSRNLSQEMKTIAEGQVSQVVDLEKRRQEMKSKGRK